MYYGIIFSDVFFTIPFENRQNQHLTRKPDTMPQTAEMTDKTLLDMCFKVADSKTSGRATRHCRELLAPLGITMEVVEATEIENTVADEVSNLRRRLVKCVTTTLREMLVHRALGCGFVKIGAPLPANFADGKILLAIGKSSIMTVPNTEQGQRNVSADPLNKKFVAALRAELGC